MLYDVYQVLDPFKLKLKLNVYDKASFALLASAVCEEETLQKELKRDNKVFLLEGQKRDQLARYLIENTHLDANRKLVFFLRSSIPAGTWSMT